MGISLFSGSRQTQGNYGVTVADGVLVGEGVLVIVGVREGVAVLVDVGVREGVGVEEGVLVGTAVGASPSRVNCPTRFQSSPTKTCTTYVPGSQSDAGAF